MRRGWIDTTRRSTRSGDSSVTIRPLESGDYPRWLELWNGYLEFYQANLAHEVTESLWRRLGEPAEDPFGLCAVMDSAGIVGIAHYLHQRSTWGISDQAYLEDLYVDPKHRSGGVGRAPIEAPYRIADDERLTHVYWLTQSFNLSDRRLYDRIASLTPFIKYEHGLRGWAY